MKVKKAILTGGGRGTRLHPVTTTINKHLIPLANKPMIFHAIDKVVAAGVTEVYINTNPGDSALAEYIGDGGHWGINIYYFEQTGGPQGIAHVVNEAKSFIGNEPFIFYLSDNILLGDITDMVREFEEKSHDCMLALSKVPDPERFGVPVFSDTGELIEVVEKPEVPASDFAVTGIYLYKGDVFFDAFSRIKKSHRGEYEISDIHSLLLKEGKRVAYKEITGWWKDTGKPNDLLLANSLLLERYTDFHKNDEIELDATIEGDVRVGIGTKTSGKVTLKGPVIIGENVSLEDCIIGPNVTIGSGCSITGASIDTSIILDHAAISTKDSITESLIGKGVTISDSQTKKRTYILGDKSVLS